MDACVKIIKIRRSLPGRIWWKIKHEFFIQIRHLGLRDRLRCPHCRKIGTRKPHRPPRRWLCKWCGQYEDIGRRGIARPCAKKRVWMLKPKKKGRLPSERIKNLNPWVG